MGIVVDEVLNSSRYLRSQCLGSRPRPQVVEVGKDNQVILQFYHAHYQHHQSTMGIFHHVRLALPLTTPSDIRQHNQQGNTTQGAADAIVSQPAETVAPNPQQQPFGQQMAQSGQQPYIYDSAKAPPTAQPVETMTPEQVCIWTDA